jgi:serine/threonine protein kinase
MRIIHRDIKPENILMDHEDNVRLSDFGFAILVDDPNFKKYTVVGTIEYYPIEMLTDK